ncbi:ankyrin repeat domain-containing protein [uncultured Xylophilus sp.]|uniref:ankyrin repeat domain-containing protein n=1 Tax=uncultured Xylophilus sp. TaxID=296832 RepID=UPI0025FCF1B0|nr:ankyrin repeat domain-containing protein [uncultured Xylophilus sp.]
MTASRRRFVATLTLASALAAAGCAHAAPADAFFVAIKRDDAGAMETLLRRGFDPNKARDERGQPGLIVAVREGSARVLRVLLAAPATQVEVRNAQDESPLMIAAIKGDLPLVKALIARDADVNKTGWTPLHYAVSTNQPQQLDIVRLLLEKSAYIDAESPNGTTPLMMAARYGSEQAVKLLFEEGADPTPRNQQGLNAADFARLADRGSLAAQLDEAVARRRPGSGVAPRRW